MMWGGTDRRAPRFVLVAAVLAGASSCGGDACDEIAGGTYRSVIEQECGLGPDGPARCHWTITFDADGTFTWTHSDVQESGGYDCDGDAIAGRNDAGEIRYEGTLGDDGGLTWEGLDYVPDG